MALRDRVRVVPTKDLTGTQARVRAETPSGSCEERVDTGVPAVDLTDQGERLRGKFRLLASARLGVERAGALADAVARIDDGESLDDLLRLCCDGGQV